MARHKLVQLRPDGTQWITDRIDKTPPKRTQLQKGVFPPDVWEQVRAGKIVVCEHNVVHIDPDQSDEPVSVPEMTPDEAAPERDECRAPPDASPRGTGANPAAGSGNADTRVFLPPYNFITADAGVYRPPYKDLIDQWATHERFLGNCGYIECELENTTPLFIPDAVQTKLHPVGEDSHKEMSLFRVQDKEFCIPGSSLKGMVRSVFEAVTRSCFTQLDDKRLCWRRAHDLPRDPRPGRLPARLRLGTNGRLALIPFEDRVRVSYRALPTHGGPGFDDGEPVETKAVQLRHHGPREAVEVNSLMDPSRTWSASVTPPAGPVDVSGNRKWAGGCRLPDTLNPRPAAGTHIRITKACELVSGKKAPLTPKKYALEIVDASGSTHSVPEWSSAKQGVVKLASRKETDETSKCTERIFVEMSTSPADHIPVPQEVEDDLKAAYPDLVKQARDGKEPLVYYQTKRNKDGVGEPHGLRIGSVEFFKEAYDISTLGAAHRDVRPGQCSRERGLCPACALFGGLFPENAAEKKAGIGLAGRVAFNPASLNEPLEDGDTDTIPLRILGGPKPSFFPFYLRPTVPQGNDQAAEAMDYNGTPWIWQGRGPRPDDHRFAHEKERVRIRGRKFYWHHPNYWTEDAGDWQKHYRLEDEHIENISDEDDRTNGRTNQNSTVELLKPGRKFKFSVDFENLSDDELRLLVWAIGLEDGLQHKLGMGKPLGLGSVKVTVKRVVTRNLAESYVDLFGEDEEVVLERADDGAIAADANDLAGQLTEDALCDPRLLNPAGLEELRIMLNPVALGADFRPSYHPGSVEPNKGFEYYMANRHQPLVTAKEAAEDGWRQSG